MKKIYCFIVALLIVCMLTNVGFAAADKADIFVGSTDLAKTLYKELDRTSTMITINSTPSKDEFAEAMLEALAQNPYAGHALSWSSKFLLSRGYSEITINYVLKEDVRKEQRSELQKKVKSAVKKIIKDSMTTEQKVDAIQRYIAANCEYDRDALESLLDNKKVTSKNANRYTAYGALIEGKAVCQGYANAFKALADAAGIRNVIIFGETKDGIPHSWNRVYDKKSWKTVDASNLDLNMWKQSGAYVAPATVKAQLKANKQSIVNSQWNTLFSTKDK